MGWDLINETVGRYRDWGYNYYIIDRSLLYKDSAWLALPRDSYVYRARIEGRIVWLVQVPWGAATSEFLLVHGSCVIRQLPSILMGSQS